MTEIKGIFDAIQNTASRNEKQVLIRANLKNDLFCKVLLFLLDNSVTTGISSKKIQKEVMRPEPWFPIASFSELMDYLKENNTGKEYDLRVVNSFIMDQPEGMREFYRQLVTKSLKVGIDAKTVNVVCPGMIPTFDVMLGTSIEHCKLKPGTWFSVSRKLNGSRCVYRNGAFYTRQGRMYCGLDHIKSDLHQLLRGLDWVIDGELVYKNPEALSDSDAFRKGIGIANSLTEEKSELKLVIFDVVPAAEFDAGCSVHTYRDRKLLLTGLLYDIAEQQLEHVNVVPVFYEGTDQQEIDMWLEYAESNDMEGVMLNLDAPYECKRTKNLIKVKRFHTVDLPIVGCEEGTGKLIGTLGALVVDFKENRVNVGSGFDDAMRAALWSDREDLPGKIVEVKYKEITKDKRTGLESLQFPIFMGIRGDKNEPSYT